MALENYRSAELVFGWSFYRQGASGGTSSADEFLDAALAWFGDPDPRLGTAWDKGERLAKLISRRRTLLVLDGLEPPQNPPGPELSVLRMLGLFDRPADERALGALLKPPAIRGLTESLTDLSQIEWRTITAKLRRARLLAEEDPHNRGHLDTHPLVREYFGEQLRSQPTDAWKECNRRLYSHYRAIAPQFPDTALIEGSFCAAISIAKLQKSVFLGKRVEGTYAEYRRQKVSASQGSGFRLPL